MALALSACATAVPAPVWSGAGNGWSAAEAEVRPVGLGIPGGVALARGVRFAGGVEWVLEPDSPLHSVSDLKLLDGGEFVSVTDAGDLVRGRLSLGATGRLEGVDSLRHRRLTLLDGRPIIDKADGDAEGLAVSQDGDVLVSFERDHRIWDYGPVDAPRQVPTALPRPDFAFTLNDGMEAIATTGERVCGDSPLERMMSRNRHCLRVAGESGGVWECAPDACAVVVAPPPEPIPDSEYRITGMDRDPSGDGYWVVERRYRPPVDVRARVRRMVRDGSLGPVLVELSLPSTVDNFEGIAATAQGGGVRIYILSDDNGSGRQRTLLLAFDVRPVR
nr:esterase-like activity of phytase family protein [Brevundimonas alba]